MPAYSAPVDDYRFLLFDVFGAEAAWQRLPAWGPDGMALDRDLAEAVLAEMGRIAGEVFAPLNRSGDEQGCGFAEGQVTTPDGFREAYRTFAEGGWCGLAGDPAFGGQGMPKMLTVAMDEFFYAANSSLALYPGLSAGAALLLAEHADDATRAVVLPKLYAGKWAGVMDLTEPHAGSDLGLLSTRAEPQADGSYRITGTKIFITGGEQDLTQNIIHLVLARLPDAPAGSAGISLFLVPKVHFAADGTLGDANAVACGAIEHKMGIKGSATAVMNFDGATGWLVGAPNRGLAAMFTMMNYERLSIGLQGLGLGDAAGQLARSYAAERVQGRSADGSAATINQHPDVQRMLLRGLAMARGGRALAVYLGLQLDLAKHAPDATEQQAAAGRVALFTPLAKAFFTDRGLQLAVEAQQVFGGHGYVREWGVEQHVRDARIAQIYEGTNGIQALDLVGRKVLRDGGAVLDAWLAEARQDVAACPDALLAAAVAEACDRLASATDGLLATPEAAPAVAVSYLDLLGYTVYGWAWCRMLTAGQGRQDEAGLQALADCYRLDLLPETLALAARVAAGAGATAGAAMVLAEG